MITNEAFGERWGRLGNQLFQLGMLFAIRQRLGYDFYLAHDGESLWECFDLDVPSEGPKCIYKFHETNGSCNYDPLVFEQPDGTSFRGYFQSYRYLDECKTDLLRFLRFKEAHRALAEAILFAYRRRYRKPLISLHVRRGDYAWVGVEDAWGNLVRAGYYERAVNAIGGDVLYLVFSDDLPWCRQNLGLENVVFADFDHFVSLCLMTRCDANIIANSSFSWWGAYLNPAGEAYAPSRWFGPRMEPPNDRQDDIVPPSWRTIPVVYDLT